MPRQDTIDQRRNRDQDVRSSGYKDINKLGNQIATPLAQQQVPEIARGQVTLGQTQFGRSANIVDTTSPVSTQIANLIQTGLKATESAVKSAYEISKIYDDNTNDELKEKIKKIEESDRLPQDKAAAIAALYDQYKPKFITRNAKNQIDDSSFKAHQSVAPLTYADLSQDFKLGQLEIETADYNGDEDKRIEDMVAYKKTWEDRFNSQFKDNPELLKKSQLLLLGYTADTNSSIESLVKDLITETAGDVREHIGDYLDERLATDPSVRDPGVGISLDEGEMYEDFVNWMQSKGITLPVDDPELSPIIQSYLQPELVKLSEGVRKAYNIKRQGLRQEYLGGRLTESSTIAVSSIVDAPINEDSFQSEYDTVVDRASQYLIHSPESLTVNNKIADSFHAVAMAAASRSFENLDETYEKTLSMLIEDLSTATSEQKQAIKDMAMKKTRSFDGVEKHPQYGDMRSLFTKGENPAFIPSSLRAFASEFASASFLQRSRLAPEFDVELAALQMNYGGTLASTFNFETVGTLGLNSTLRPQLRQDLNTLLVTWSDQNFTDKADAFVWLQDAIQTQFSFLGEEDRSALSFNLINFLDSDEILSNILDLRSAIYSDLQSDQTPLDISTVIESSETIVNRLRNSPFAQPDASGNVQFGLAPSPALTAQMAANDGEATWETFLSSALPDPIDITSGPVSQSADAVVGVLNSVVFNSQSPIFAALEGIQNKGDRRNRFFEVVDYVTNGEATVLTKQSLFQLYSTIAADPESPEVRETAITAAKGLVVKDLLKSEFMTESWVSLERTSPDQVGNLEKSYQRLDAALDNKSSSNWIDLMYQAFGEEAAPTIISYYSDLPASSRSMLDIQQFVTSSGFVYEDNQLKPAVDSDDPTALPNQAIIRFGTSSNGTPESKVAYITEYKNYFTQLGETNDVTSSRAEAVSELLGLNYQWLSTNGFIELLNESTYSPNTSLDKLAIKIATSKRATELEQVGLTSERGRQLETEGIEPSKRDYEIARLMQASFDPEVGLTYKGLITLDMYARSSFALQPGMYQQDVRPVLRNGGVYFEIPDPYVEQGRRRAPMSVELPYLGQSAYPYAAYSYGLTRETIKQLRQEEIKAQPATWSGLSTMYGASSSVNPRDK